MHSYLNKSRIRNKISIFAVFKTLGQMNMDLDIFKYFLEQMESEYVELPLHSHVRWLSQGNVLNKLVSCLEHIEVFLNEKEQHFLELKDTE